MTYASYVDQRSLGDVVTDNTMILWLTYQMFISCSCKVCCRTRQLSTSTFFYTSISWPRLSDTSPSCATPYPKHSLFTGSWGREQTELHISSLKCFYPEVTLMNCSYFIHQNKSYSHVQFQNGGEVWFFHISGKRGGHWYWQIVVMSTIPAKLPASLCLTCINAPHWKDCLWSTAFSLFNNKVPSVLQMCALPTISLFKCLCVCFLNK